MAQMVLKDGLVDFGDGEFEVADVVVDGGRIAAVGREQATADGTEVVDCSDSRSCPGWSTPTATPTKTGSAGRWDNLPLEPWMLFSYPALAGPVQSAREIYLRTLIGGLDMIRSGATCVVDFLYEMAGFTDESLAAVTRPTAIWGCAS